MDTFEHLKIENPGNAERLAYVDFKLRFTGVVKRSDICEMFSLGEAAASKIIAEYNRINPGNMEHNRTLKANAIVRDKYTPYVNLSADTALGMLAHGFNRNKLMPSASLSIPFDRIDKVPNQLNIADVEKITRAIYGGYSICCKYISENSDNHGVRTLLPLAILYDGTTWMFRAYDRNPETGSKFKNFHFCRTRKVLENSPLGIHKRKQNEELISDKAWQQEIPLQLKLHSNLQTKEGDSQKVANEKDRIKRRIRMDFGMADGSEEIMLSVKAAYLWILERKWFIDRRDPLKKALDEEENKPLFFKFELTNRETVDFLVKQFS
ncbi:transcriptional regulator [Vibrio aestuarianus subsp. cardii]|uniref:transcriptional regulator n=1 Tax=Vibrio aestuarianus TaxID=28171 RepID=UPI001594687C|nr:transcriptional regulator [Vibrio aestuarianus]MDE1309332.1 transcriptional regulator [Vibrio aestuarianus]NGZ92416.1 transcriptional regulator [Vibrio aestuarianus subsp. cardii]